MLLVFRRLFFRIEKLTVYNIIPEVCNIIWEVLQPIYLRCPQKEDEWIKIANDFYNIWNFPNCIGAIDGKHCRIQAPPNSAFHNYKGHFSLILMAIVDGCYRFVWIDVGDYAIVARWIILQKPLAQKLDTIEKIVQAITCLHNYILSTNLNYNYFHEGFVDQERVDGEVIPGNWRSDVRENGFMNPLGRIGANIGTSAVMKQRDSLARYFVSTEGSIPWQWEHI
ncbi:hypothetical protein ALC57_18453 [Trachymyrmex cornetzi]|uniref:Nuclease HARBI1 n=1 Tax=Trachymyrmex cornetzi TaxID=471704 RepID=A0A151IS50_9HYME|nr:hypothetical protein ALC57_18453 [Trachymyrmex cornetzi]